MNERGPFKGPPLVWLGRQWVFTEAKACYGMMVGVILMMRSEFLNSFLWCWKK